MTKDEAEALVFDFIDAVRAFERADQHQARYYRQLYETQRDRLISALSSHQDKTP